MQDDENLIETEDQITDGEITGDEGAEPEPRAPEPPKRMSVREAIQDAVRQRDESGKFVKKDETPKPSSAKPAAPASSIPDKGTVIPPDKTEPPDAWKSKEWRPLWDGLAPQVRSAIQKREADMHWRGHGD